MPDPTKPIQEKPKKKSSITQSELNKHGFYGQGSPVIPNDDQDLKILQQQLDYLNANKLIAWEDSTKYYNLAQKYNNFKKANSNFLVDKQDQYASKYTPLNNTPTKKHDEVVKLYNQNDEYMSKLENFDNQSDWFTYKELQPVNVEEKYGHTDIPFARNRPTVNRNLNAASISRIGRDKYNNNYWFPLAEYNVIKPTKPVPYTIDNSSANASPVHSIEFIRPSHQQIPTKTPTITPIQQAIDDELRTSFIEPAITYPKDVRRYTAGQYLESQGKPSGYVNYGDNKGRKPLMADGGYLNNNNTMPKQDPPKKKTKDPIYVSDPKDPRLKAYEDSLHLFDTHPLPKDLHKYDRIDKFLDIRNAERVLGKDKNEKVIVDTVYGPSTSKKINPIGHLSLKPEYETWTPTNKITKDGGEVFDGTALIDIYKQPVQKVVFEPLLKLPKSEEKPPQTVPVQNAITYPKDVQRFTAGNYLESQGKSSGYVNYGDNKGRKELYNDGGLRTNNEPTPTINDFYTEKDLRSMGAYRSYPYRTLQNPSYGNININPINYNDNIIHPIRIEKRFGPSSIPDDGSSIEKPTFRNGGINNINRSNISETFDEMILKPYLNK